MLKNHYFILVLGLNYLTMPSLLAQKTQKASGKAEILLEDSYCIGNAKKQAEDLAKIEAIEKAFGRVIVQGTNTYIVNTQTGEKVTTTTTQMNTIANSMVRGEWIETTSLKQKWLLRERDKKQELWLLCEIEGRIREITEAQTALEIQTMRCPNTNCQTQDFKQGEPLLMQFRSPATGFLSVFMEENGVVYRLFPYKKMPQNYQNHVPIQADKLYTLFSIKDGKNDFKDVNAFQIDEYELDTGSKDQLFNRIYVIFSTKPYPKPALETTANDMPQSLSPAKLQAWIAQNKGIDKQFQVRVLDITISKR